MYLLLYKDFGFHADIALDVLSDMFFNSRFEEKDIEVEKKVILEEIGMYEDSPEELVHDILSETVWRIIHLDFPFWEHGNPFEYQQR